MPAYRSPAPEPARGRKASFPAGSPQDLADQLVGNQKAPAGEPDPLAVHERQAGGLEPESVFPVFLRNRGLKSLLIAGFGQPLRQPEPEHSVLLRASRRDSRLIRVLRKILGGLKKGGKAFRGIKPPAAEKGVSGGADAQIFVPVPVFQIMAAFLARNAEIGNFILEKPGLLQCLAGGQVQVGGLVVAGQVKSLSLLKKPGARCV